MTKYKNDETHIKTNVICPIIISTLYLFYKSKYKFATEFGLDFQSYKNKK